MSLRVPDGGRRRVVIENITPQVDCGRFPIKRVVGENVVVEADAFTDGHDAIRCEVIYRPAGAAEWTHAEMQPLPNDRWRGEFRVPAEGRFEYAVRGWVDHFLTWRRDMVKRIAAGTDTLIDYVMGAELVGDAASRASMVGDAASAASLEAGALLEAAARLRSGGGNALALDEALTVMVLKYPDRSLAAEHSQPLTIVVDRERARFSSWYEFFPRSTSSKPGVRGTLRDAEEYLPQVAEMGFDVVYLPPIHPIGRKHRKGKNNRVTAEPDDTGSPWAIGAEEGGHKSVHPELGTCDDVCRLAARARELGMELALDIALQAAPDHPYVATHPEWFRGRPDGSIQYAENPPKKYQDIYPFDFESREWQALWEEMKSIFDHWIDHGVAIFRVDNPHTKPFPFWEWAIDEIKRDHPEVLFLAEAFTRPKVMHRLAKLGYTQSYTYFPWRNTKAELISYFTELTQTPVREFFRPNHWPNTPDILTEYLQTGGRPAFAARLVLAATLGANYGVYGPAFELMEFEPREPGSEEYLDSEKYQVRQWDLNERESLRDLMTRVNRIRRENEALHSDWSLRFHPINNEQIIAYSKQSEDGSNLLLVVVNLDPHHKHSGMLQLETESLEIDVLRPYQAHDLLSDARYIWQGSRNYIELDPSTMPAQIFRIRRRMRTEREFEYFL